MDGYLYLLSNHQDNLKELGKMGYRILPGIQEIKGNFLDTTVTKDLLVFVEPLNMEGMIKNVDEAVGAIYQKLNETGLIDNTIFMFTIMEIILKSHGAYHHEYHVV